MERKFYENDLVRLVGNKLPRRWYGIGSTSGELLRLRQGEILKVVQYRRAINTSFGCRPATYSFDQGKQLLGYLTAEDTHKNFELYKRHDREFCLGDMVRHLESGLVVPIIEVKRGGVYPYDLGSPLHGDSLVYEDEIELVEPAWDRPDWLPVEKKEHSVVEAAKNLLETLEAETTKRLLNPPMSERQRRTGRRDEEL